MKTILNYFIPLCASSILLFSSCQDKKVTSDNSSLDSLKDTDTTSIQIDVEENTTAKMPIPFVEKTHSKSVEETYNAIKSAIEANGNLKIIAELNHSKAAEDVAIKIPESRLIIFGNPKVGTQLMQQNQKIGMDLPMKILVYDNNGITKVIYSNASILFNRYEISLPEIEQKINELLNKITHSEVEETKLQDLKLKSILSELQTKESTLSVDKASEKLEKLLKDKEFKLFAKVEHDKAAKKENLELRPTRLFVFGKPEVGSKLMEVNSTIGLDLPMKILIYQDENGKTQVSFFKGSFLAARHGIDNQELTNKIDEVLEMLSNEILK